jgi:hypothetical protein
MEGGPTFLRRLFDMEALIDEAMCRCSGIGDNLSVDNCGSCWRGNVSKGQIQKYLKALRQTLVVRELVDSPRGLVP